MTISRWRTCASHAFVPLLSMRRQSAPSTIDAFPSAGALNEVVHGRLVPSSKVLFFRRLLPPPLTTAPPVTGALLPAPAVFGASTTGALPGGAPQPTPTAK